jgi:hypothetical protein
VVFHTCIYCTSISSNPSNTLSLSSLPPYYSTASSAFHYAIFIHKYRGARLKWWSTFLASIRPLIQKFQ